MSATKKGASDYDDFKKTIQKILRRSKKPLAWAEIKEKAGFKQKVPNNRWVKQMEVDIGLIREKDEKRRTVWRLG